MVTLEEIVSGSKTRERLKIFLGQFPLTHHPNDIERLDHFIIELHRYGSNYSRSKFHDHLKNDLKWEDRDIDWRLDRIDIGVRILAARKSFRMHNF